MTRYAPREDEGPLRSLPGIKLATACNGVARCPHARRPAALRRRPARRRSARHQWPREFIAQLKERPSRDGSHHAHGAWHHRDGDPGNEGHGAYDFVTKPFQLTELEVPRPEGVREGISGPARAAMGRTHQLRVATLSAHRHECAASACRAPHRKGRTGRRPPSSSAARPATGKELVATRALHYNSPRPAIDRSSPSTVPPCRGHCSKANSS